MQLRYQFNSYHLMHKQDSYLRYKDKQNSKIGLDALGLALLRIGVSVLVLSLLLEFLLHGVYHICKRWPTLKGAMHEVLSTI
jgi:hypothetical protein